MFQPDFASVALQPAPRTIRPLGRIVGMLLACALSAGIVQAADKVHPGHSVRGMLVSRTETMLVVRPEGQQETRQYSIPPLSAMDAKTAAFFRTLTAGCEVQVTAVSGQGSRSLDVLLMAGPGKFGLLAGKVSDKAPAAAGKNPDWIEIKDDDGGTHRYTPPWAGSGFDPTLGKAFGQRMIGDCVEFRWFEDDHRRMRTMRVVAMSPQAAKGDAGTVAGEVVDKGKDWITIQTGDGEKNRYVPQPVIGADAELDKAVQKAISQAKVGRRVEGAWFDDGERRLYSLKVLPAAKAAR